ncbi:MAG TPA: hypothetical protein VK861_08710 [Bacteroidales bacterium]|nr:hypothetical protein [Bacteroidales bacterium]
MKKFLRIAGLILILFLAVIAIWVNSNMKDINPGYTLDLKVEPGEIAPLNAGFAAVAITPEVPDRWIDINGNAKYKPKEGDTYIDGNGNGMFDAVWIAGFGNRRAANGINDDLWARTMVIDDGTTRIAMVVLDLMGFMHDDVIDVRRRIPESAGITYTIIASTHNHQAPDMVGLWGKSALKSGVNSDYLEFVKIRTVQSVMDAVNNIRPAQLQLSEDMTGAAHLVVDTRKPEVFDSGLRFIRVVDRENGSTLGTLSAWGNHPETLWSKNLMITSDFPHYMREGIEKGVYNKDTLVLPGTGGTALYANGAIGGLMTTNPGLAIKDPFTGEEFGAPSFEKAEAQGKQLALLALRSMDEPLEIIDSASISLIAQTLSLPIKNRIFRLATMLGIFPRGSAGWMKMRSEVSAFTIGEISFATLPGEVYPEIINGGIEAPEGRDFIIDPLEEPSVRDMMPGRFKFVLGLANDEIGYIIPKSQWDMRAPFTYGAEKAPYGEVNSLGPETAPILHGKLKEILDELRMLTK